LSILPKLSKPTRPTLFLLQKPTSPFKRIVKNPNFLKIPDFQNPKFVSFSLSGCALPFWADGEGFQ